MTPPRDPHQALPDVSRGRVSSFQPWTVAVVVGLLALSLAVGFYRWHQQVNRSLTRSAVAGRMAPRRLGFEHAIEQRMSLLDGVAAHVAMGWGHPDLPETFDRYAELIRGKTDNGIRALQYIRNGIIVHTWPLNDNRAAVGQDLRQHPEPQVRDDYLRAATPEGVGPILSGPVPLYQGGIGLIGRLRAPVAGDSVTVVVGLVIDVANLLAESGLSDSADVMWVLRDSDGQRIAGATDAAMAGEDPVGLSVRLPDRTWRLEGIPREGWLAATPDRSMLRLILAALVAMLAALGYLTQSRFKTRVEAAQLRDRQRSEAQVASLFQLVPDGLAVIELDSDRYVRVNDAYCQISGRSRDKLIGQTVAATGMWASESDRAEVIAQVRSAGELAEYPLAVVRPDGSIRNSIVSSRIVDLDGVPHCLTVLRDVHDRLALERRVVESQRLEAIGRLAGGVAHDFNNLITAISGYADLALDEVPQAAPPHRFLLEIRRASRRAAELTRQLLTFARRQVVLPRRADLRTLVSDAEPLLRQLISDTVSLEVRLPPQPVPVIIDPAQFEQALINITVNARDAMPQGGVVVMTVAEQDGEGTVAIRDGGVGIPAAAIPHLFEPFYTTKEVGRGTGLGLATVYGIMEQAGGVVTVDSVVGSGTTMTIRLPLASSAGVTPIGVKEPLPSLPAAREHEAIIVVDDESQVRDICVRMLTRLGYQVRAVADGAAAIGLLAEDDRVNLVLTDLVMPGIGGLELREWIIQHQHAAGILLMSGYSEDMVGGDSDATPFLAKPFTALELALAVRKALDRAPGSEST